MQPDQARILDILLAAEEIAAYIRGMSYQDYLASSVTRAGVQWHVFTIGEAVRQLSDAFKATLPSIPWAKIVGARNILAHQYGKVDHAIMWEIATVHVPALAAELKPFGPHEVEQ